MVTPSSTTRGSSPQMRGALPGVVPLFVIIRIIPADAGSTVPDYFGSARGQDHPRRCGEHGSLAVEQLEGEGSSPQMRGAPSPDLTAMRTMWIIPADAGSTRLVQNNTKYD